MTELRNINIRLKKSDIFRREGIGKQGKTRPEVKSLLDELLEIVEQQKLIKTAAIYQSYTLNEVKADDCFKGNNSAGFMRDMLAQIWEAAKEVVFAVCTIGPDLERLVSEYSARKEPLQAFLLDGIGSAAIDALGFEVCRKLAQDASLRGCQTSSPLGPGMQGFDIRWQWKIFELVPADRIGVRLSDSGLMIPRKSLSMIIGIGQDMKRWSRAEVCSKCELKDRCPYVLKTKAKM